MIFKRYVELNLNKYFKIRTYGVFLENYYLNQTRQNEFEAFESRLRNASADEGQAKIVLDGILPLCPENSISPDSQKHTVIFLGE